MKSTLGERLILAMAGPPKVTGKELADACGVAPPSVSDWRNGKTKTMEGGNLLAAAKKLKVRPDWLKYGTGPMHEGATNHTVEEPSVSYLPPKKPDKLTDRLIQLFSQLDNQGKKELISHVEFFVAGRRPHPNGKAPALAGKK